MTNIKRLNIFLQVVILLVIAPACKNLSEQESKRNIILDVDTSVDDIMTILYFLGCPDVNIKAITIANGVSSVDSGAEIVLRLLSLTGHTEIPVAKGEVLPLEGDNAFPAEWQPRVDKPFGLELPGHNLTASRMDASGLIAKLATAYKDNITVLALGPMTNIARAFINDPRLAQNINEIYVSDGSVKVEGGIYMEYPAINNRVSGWNLWVDPQAAAVVFNSGAPVVLVPLDLTSLHGNDPLVLTSDFYEEYRVMAGSVIGTSMATLMQNWLGSYVADQQPDTTVKSVPVWDLVAGMIWHHPAIATAWDECHAGIVLGTDEVAGQIVTSDTGVHNVRICMRGNQNRLDSLLLITTKAGKQ